MAVVVENGNVARSYFKEYGSVRQRKKRNLPYSKESDGEI